MSENTGEIQTFQGIVMNDLKNYFKHCQDTSIFRLVPVCVSEEHFQLIFFMR